MDLQNTINYLLTPVTNAYWLKLENAMNEIGLHSGQVFILISLWENNGQNQVELAANLNLTPPTINKMVKNLARNKFVKMQKSKEDGRVVKVFLTDKGFEIRPSVEEQWQKLETDIFKDFSETEKLIMFQLFDKLKNNLINDAVSKKSV